MVEITDAKHSFLKWLPALCSYSIKNTSKGFEGELHFKKNVFPFVIAESGGKSTLEVRGSLPNELVYLLRRLTGAPDKPCGVGRADANPKLLLNDT